MSTVESAPDPFSARAWHRTAALQRAILDHPFNRTLSEGTLEEDRFAFYLIQDARFLVGFSHALAAAAARAPDTVASAFFAGGAQGALIDERSLHTGELTRLGWSEERSESVPTSPACLAYTSYLGAAALREPWPVLVAALLPCFWVYHEVGTAITERTAHRAEHPYRAWIATYADEAFGHSARTVREIADRAAAEESSGVTAKMLAAFERATEYEWMFWESAWILESWPTARWLA